MVAAGGDVGLKTRVRGIALAAGGWNGASALSTSGRHPGNGYGYDETAADPSRQYNGRVFDPGTGFHDYGARMYWPEIGRFISADTYGGSPVNPASLNRYAYVLNNPYKYIDPTGHIVEVEGSKMENALKELRSTETGEKLYSQLRDSKNIFRLKEGEDGAYSKPDSDYNARFGWRNREGSGGTTSIDFKKKYVFEDESGKKQQAPFSQVLAHEMKHLADYDEGSLDLNPDPAQPTQTRSDRDAMRTESKVRKELHLPGERRDYGKTWIYDKTGP